MELNNKYGNMPEIALWGVITIILGAVGLSFPILFIFTAMLSPIPISIITYRYKETAAGIVSLAGLIILSVLYGLPFGLIQFSNFAVVGIVIGYVLRNRFGLKKSIVIGGAAFILAFIFSNYILQLFFNIKVIQQFVIDTTLNFFQNNKENLIRNFRLFIDTVKPKNVTPESLYEDARTSITLMLSQIPAFLLAITWTGSFIILEISNYIIKRILHKELITEKFSLIKLPFSLALVYVITQLIVDSNISNGNMDRWTIALLNMSWAIGFCFMAQGLAIIDYWFNKLGLKGILKGIVYIIGCIVILPFAILINLPMLLIFLGMFDYLMDFRKLEIKKS